MAKIVVTDIDGTLLCNNVYQHTIDRRNGTKYSVDEFAKLDWRWEDLSIWDFNTEWESRELNVESILRCDPIQHNWDRLRQYKAEGYQIVYLTSRGGGLEKSIQADISKALSTRLGYAIEGYALGDYQTYGTDKVPEKKRRILAKLVETYTEVIFIDDEDKNLDHARSVPGVVAIKA